MRSKLAIALSILSLVTVSSLARAEDEVVIAEKIQKSRKEIVEAEAQKRKILGSLYVINQRMKKITNEKSALTNQLFQVQGNVRNIAKLIAGLELQIDKQRIQLRRRLRALYKMSGQGYMAMIFSRDSAADLDETLRFLKIVTDKDYQLIKSYQTNIAVYKAQRNKLKTQVEKLVGLEQDIKKQEGLLANEHDAKSKIASALEKEKSENLNRIKSIRKQAIVEDKIASDTLSDLLKPSIYEQKGQLAMPVQGFITQDFGLMTDDHYKISLSHKGWRVATEDGAIVSAIYDGTVLYSAKMDGYGHTVIIDHGDHYYTVYGYLSHVSVSVGDTIKKGQSIAESGVMAPLLDRSSKSARAETGEGIYFEIRHFSEPENPANWIIKKDMQQASVAQLNGAEYIRRLAQ